MAIAASPPIVLTPPQENIFRRLPREIFIMVCFYWSIEDVCRLARVSKLFCAITGDSTLWKQIAEQLQVRLNVNLHPKQAFKDFYEDKKDRFFFANRIIGPITFSEFIKIPKVHYVHTRKLAADWRSQAPAAAIVFGSKWETYIHRYINFMGFSIIENQRDYTFIVVLEVPDEFTPEKKEYLARLMKGNPCGIWGKRWEKNAGKEEPRRLRIDRTSINELDQQGKSAIRKCSVVQLIPPHEDGTFNRVYTYF